MIVFKVCFLLEIRWFDESVRKLYHWILYMRYPKNMDPRFFRMTYKGRKFLYLLMNYPHDKDRHFTRVMMLAKVDYDHKGFYIAAENIHFYDASQFSWKIQKNWVPYVQNDQLLLALSINPHVLINFTFDPDFDDEKSKRASFNPMAMGRLPFLYEEVLSHTYWNFPVSKNNPIQLVTISHSTQFNDTFWVSKYGELRGGTPAITYNESHFLSIFHSSHGHSNKFELAENYFIGAYLVERQWPNRVSAMSRKPIGLDFFYYGNITAPPLAYV